MIEYGYCYYCLGNEDTTYGLIFAVDAEAAKDKVVNDFKCYYGYSPYKWNVVLADNFSDRVRIDEYFLIRET